MRDSKADEEAVHRQRVCKKCGHIFFTVETDAKSHYAFYEAKANYDRSRYDKRKKK